VLGRDERPVRLVSGDGSRRGQEAESTDGKDATNSMSFRVAYVDAGPLTLTLWYGAEFESWI
jgi:hypothetical protein